MTTGGPEEGGRRDDILPFEHSADGVLFTTPDGAVHAANPAAGRLLRRRQDDICAAGRAALVDPTDDRWGAADLARRTDRFFKGPLRMVRGDGSTFEADVTSATFVEDGEERAYLIFSDGSESAALLRQAAAEVELAEIVMDTLDSISDGYLAVEQDWTLSYLNQRAEQLLGMSRRDVFGRNLWEVFPDARANESRERYERVLRTGTAETFETYHAAAGLHFEVRAYRLRGGGLGAYFLDISERRAAQLEREALLAGEKAARAAAEAARVELARRAAHDELSGLLNRSGLLDRVARATAEQPTAWVTVMLIDLDRFKHINDTLGHAAGDRFLEAFAARLRDVVGPGPLLARFGGDEFVVALVGSGAVEVDDLARRIIAMSTQTVVVGSNTLLATASVGIAHSDGDADLGRLLREADAAMYSAKDAGRERAAWFDQRLHVQAVQRMQVEQELRTAVGSDELIAHYQPAFDLRTGATVHVEALARWQHPGRGLVPPAAFISVAEESGLIGAVGRVILTRAAAQARLWADVPELRVWVNVSPRQLALPGLCDLVALTLEQAGVPPERLGIEVTESVMAERGRMHSELQAVHDLGVAIAIDDFGTGYSSLARLSAMPFDVIKIDRSFVAQLGTVTGDALVTGIVTLAHSIGAHVIAEGVETEAQLAQVTASGCDSAAGYFMARPGPAADVRWLLDPEAVGAGALRR